jgi:heme exporter protein A
MSDYLLKGESLQKNFGRRLIFQNLGFNYSENGVYGIAGANGSGKSTLVKIIAGLIAPSAGKLKHMKNGDEIISEKLHNHIGFVSPYLVLYDEFSAEENLRFISDIRGVPYDQSRADWLLDQFKILNRKTDPVKAYSSGMKQRLKFVFALLHDPSLLIFDEPTSNLDSAGKEVVYRIINTESASKIILVASNEQNDLSLCESTIELESYKLNMINESQLK